MKKNLHFYLILIALICSCHFVFSQQISINDNVSIQQLIEDNLVEGCVEISNVTSSVNGTSSGFSSYAEFDRASSNFPFENGIMLSTGNAESGGNTINTNVLSEGAPSWGTDPDLESALGINNTLNATSIEFDFVSISDQVSFNYLFASEEYSGVFPCQVADGFAFLIKETGSAAPYQNIALVPGTSTPVSIGTIHEEVVGVCSAANDQYFDGFNLGDTNYNGRTTVLTASAPITPYVQYHIKLVIADQGDRTWDSAVFIEGDSFKILDLGDDITTCASAVTLDADINNPTSTYEWFFNNSTTPIVGAIDPTYEVTQTGTYKVEITNQLNNSADCIEEDEIIVTLSSEEAISTISNYELCDDLSGDQTEIFDLNTKNSDVLVVNPFSNPSYSYHYSDAEARSNTGEITAPISNTINPQPIFVRIEDLDSGCFAYTSFDLIVNIIPNITAPSSLAECDSDTLPDGQTIIDLTQKDDEITGGISNYIVSYHYNPLDATTGNNPVPDPTSYTNTNTNNNIADNLFIRVVNGQTGCFNTTTLTVDVTTSPIVNRETEYLDACDQDHDGTAEFNLTDAIPNILDGLTDPVTVTFHESFEDADNDENPIGDDTNYQNISPDVQVIFVRVEDDNTGCATITFLEIHTNLLVTGTDTGDFALCDDDGNDGIVNFNLTVIETQIANDLPNIVVNFFETQDDLDNNVAVSKTAPYPASNPTTLLITIDNGICSEVEEIDLVVNPVLLFTPLTPTEYCDDDDDGIVSIEMATFDELITGGNTDFGVRYYPSENDAELNTGQLPPFYQNTNLLETIFARIENDDTGCTTINSFDIQIVLAPTITEPQPYLICDDDGDGFSVLNLEDKISEIVASTTGLNIDFFTDSNDAETNTSPISLTDRVAYNANTQTVFVRVENTTSGCHDVATLEIIVNTLPIFDTISNFQTCEDDGDFRADFLFSDKDAEILNGQAGKEVLYFEDDTFTTQIDKNTLYTNIASPQTIYIRVQNITDPNCFGTASFTIEVGANPVYTAPSPFLECDDPSNDEISIFDLNDKIDEINQNGAQDNTITFHLNITDAENNSAPQPLLFTNTLNPQTLFARIESIGSQCVIIENFGINVIAAPDLSDAEPFVLCDSDYDGETIFNLENAVYDNFDRILTGIEVHYFENESDTDNDLLSITNPDSYPSSSKTVYIKVTNTFTTCYTVIPLELVVNPPPTINTIGTVPICDNDTDTFDLLQVNDLIVDDPSTVNISYHFSNNEALNNLAPITQNIFNYTTSNHTFYIRIENPITGCITTSTFVLQINENPIANTPPDLADCEDDSGVLDGFDGLLEFDLTQNNNAILGVQTAANYTIYYYNNDIANAENDTNRLSNLHTAVDGEIIYARIQNNATGCFDVTQFNITVHPLPIIPIESIEPLCFDDLPMLISAETGNIGDIYEWDNGQTTPEITFESTDLGDHWVDVTTTNGCTHRKEFTLIESEKATITITPTVHFADPNSITVDIESNTRGNYVYILDEAEGGEPQTSNIFDNVTFGRHLVTVRDLNGCMDETREVFVFDIPKFVTPNNDSYFDTWHIIGIDQLPGTVVYIFNRHGKLLKTLPDTSMGWDGTFNGQNMPSDDYWFSANIIQDGEPFNIRGHFALKR
ncbi:MAG: choice-of-anchor L domain-containing protein [Algibacter sp.]